MRLSSGISLVVTVIILSAPAMAQEKKTLTPEEIVGLSTVHSPAIHPNGDYVLYLKREAVLNTNNYHTSLWRVDISTGAHHRLTWGDTSVSSPAWSPDGNTISFERDGRLWLLPVRFGEAKPVLEMAGGINDYRWMPDGDSMLILTTEVRSPEQQAVHEAAIKRGDDAVVVDDRLWNNEFHLFSLSTGKTLLLNAGQPGIEDFDLSADGSLIVYSTNYSGKMDDDLEFDLWLVDVETGESKQLTDFPGPETSPSFSPDGSRIAYLSTTQPDVEYAQSNVTVIPVSPGPEPTVLTSAFDYTILRSDWIAEDQIAAIAAVKTRNRLIIVSPDSRGEDMPAMVSTAGWNPSRFDVASNGLFVLHADSYPGLDEILLLDVTKQHLQKLTSSSAQLDAFALPEQRIVSYENEGQPLEAILVLPPGYSEGTRLPLVLEYHGGPYGRRTNSFRDSWQAFAAAGYAVVAPNYRGGYGYGDAFGKALYDDFGGVDYRDSIAAVDYLIDVGIADADRLAVTGGSWGGYLTNWTITQTDRFDAAVSLFGIFSFYTDMSNSIQPGFEKMYFGGHYWEGNPKYRERAPQTYVTNIDTPVLIMHGQQDVLTFIANSNEMYTALKMLGKTVEYVQYPREGHGFREPRHRVDYLERTLAWFNTYVR